MHFIKITLLIVCTFFTTPAFSQWTEIALPSRSPENKFVRINDIFFTYQPTGGIYKSIDQGHHWVRTNTGLPSTFQIRDLISFHDTLFVSTFDEGIFLSKDLGESWEIVKGLPQDAYSDFAVHQDRLFTINPSGLIFAKQERGSHWTQINDPITWNNDSGENRWIFSNGQNLLFAIGEGQLYQSEDNGTSWIQVNFGKSLYALSLVYDIAIYENTIWIATVDQNYTPILLYSLDSGKNWKILNITGGFHVQSVAVSNEFVGYVLNGRIYYSANNGESWISKYIAAEKIVNLNAAEFMISSSGGVKIFNASTGSISDFESQGIKGYDFSNLEFTENEIIVFSNDLFSINKADDTLTKIPKSNGQLYNLQDIAVLQGNLFGEFNNKVFHYNYQNHFWKPTFVEVDNIYSIAAGQKRLFAQSTHGLYFSEVGSEVLTQTDISTDGYMHSVFENDTLTIINASNEILISRDGAFSWESKDPDSFDAYYFSTVVTKSKIFTCTINGLFVSEDTGKTWKKIESELIKLPQALLYHDGRLYLGTKDKILVSPDEGLHWFKKTDNSDFYFPTKNLFADKTHLFTNTMGGGIWKIELQDLYDAPVIKGVVSNKLEYNLAEEIVLEMQDLMVTDNDNTYPNDFRIQILEGEKYEVKNKRAISLKDPQTRELQVNLQVTDGTTLSNVFAVPIIIVEPLGLVEDKNEFPPLLYPNPTRSHVYIKVRSKEAATIYVYDLLGRLAQQTTTNTINSIIKLDVSNLAAGQYIISINQGNNVQKQKLIKN